MKKNHIIISMVIISGLILVTFFHFKYSRLSNQQDILINTFSQYKSECKIFDAEDGESRIYKSNLFNFSFTYPEGSLVCERQVENNFDSYEDDTRLMMEIAVWSKANFFSDGASLPDLILHINNIHLPSLPASEILHSEEIDISGITTYKKLQKSSLCTTNDCPTFISISLIHEGNNIEIQSWTDSKDILDSFRLN